MFHVSTLLQYFPADPQQVMQQAGVPLFLPRPLRVSHSQNQVERKRHLGNDVVLIVFRERGQNAPFNPRVIRSQFNRTLPHPLLGL